MFYMGDAAIPVIMHEIATLLTQLAMTVKEQ